MIIIVNARSGTLTLSPGPGAATPGEAAFARYVSGDHAGLRELLGATSASRLPTTDREAFIRIADHLAKRIPYASAPRFETHLTALAYQKLLSHRASHPRPWIELMDLFLDHALVDEGEAVHAQAVTRFPDHPGVVARGALIAWHRGRHEEAERGFAAAAQACPTDALIGLNLATLHYFRGDTEGAERHVRAVLSDHPKNVLGLRYLLQFARPGVDAPETAAARALLDDPSRRLSAVERAGLLGALAAIHDRAGDHPEAFRLAEAANAAFDEVLPFDLDRWRELFAATIETFSAERVTRQGRAWSSSTELPVLIVGMPRSGTSLVESILARHPQVASSGELKTLSVLAAGTAGGAPHATGPSGFDATGLQHAVEAYVGALRHAGPQAQRVIDKMPTNFLQLGLIAGTLPRARIIWCRRDPLDTCLSCFLTNFVEGLSFTHSLYGLGAFYRLQEQLMRHWEAVMPNPFMEIQYESLVDDPDRISRKMIDFIGLDWDPACLDHRSGDLVTTASALQVREPINRRAIGRWKRYASHLEPLRRGLSDFQP